MAELSDAHALAIERSCALTAVALSKQRREGVRLPHWEGKAGAEWVLLDYGYLVVHVFSERARQFYDLERLWRTAERLDFPSAEKLPESRGESESDTLQP